MLLLIVLHRTQTPALEKSGFATDHGIEAYWWPKLAIPAGWKQDKDACYRISCNVLVPKGKTFDTADTAIYARAKYQKGQDVQTLDECVRGDIEGARKHDPNVNIQKVLPSIKDGSGKQMPTYSFVFANHSFEVACYKAEGDYKLTFVINSSSKTALTRDLPVFKRILSSYK